MTGPTGRRGACLWDTRWTRGDRSRTLSRLEDLARRVARLEWIDRHTVPDKDFGEYESRRRAAELAADLRRDAGER